MKAATLMLAAICFTPAWAAAQDPPATPPPPPQAVDRAVPRGETRGEVRAPRGENRAPERTAERPVRAPRAESDERPSRREVISTSTPPPAPAATAVAAESQEPRGAVRRPPPSDGSAGSGDRAIPRAEAPPPPESRAWSNHGRTYYPNYPRYSRYYDPWGYGAFGLGYYYSPWSWYPYGYGAYPSYGSYYPSYGGTYGYDVGTVKIKVKPRDAEVWVDGYYAGTVDDFDGVFQALRLDSGAYRVEVRKPGFATLTYDLRIQPERNITVRGDMRPAVP